MNRASNFVRFLALGAAFLGVMAFTGGFLGAIGGLLLMLLTHNVLSLGMGLLEVLPTTAALGVLGFVGYGLFLVAPYIPTVVLEPRMPATVANVVATNTDSN